MNEAAGMDVVMTVSGIFRDLFRTDDESP